MIPNMLLELAKRHGLVTLKAACVVSGLTPNAAAKKLARHTRKGMLVKAPYIFPRAYWHPRHPLGAQSLIRSSSLLFRCVLAEPRLWTPEGEDGPATLITCEGEREALFVDYGASPRYVAGKLARWCEDRDTSELTALGIVVPTEAKAESIHRAVQDLPLPVRYTVSEDLRSLSCAKTRP